MIDVYGPINTGVGAGGAGVATANATGTQSLRGKLVGVYVRYNDSPPATTDLTLTATGGFVPERAIAVLTNINTSGYYPVRAADVKAADGTAAGTYSQAPLFGDKIKVTIAQANDGDNADVWLFVEDSD